MSTLSLYLSRSLVPCPFRIGRAVDRLLWPEGQRLPQKQIVVPSQIEHGEGQKFASACLLSLAFRPMHKRNPPTTHNVLLTAYCIYIDVSIFEQGILKLTLPQIEL